MSASGKCSACWTTGDRHVAAGLDGLPAWFLPVAARAHILQNDRLSVQRVACYIHNTKAMERS